MSEHSVRVELQVTNEQGLHARPASQLVSLANRFQSQITLLKEGKRVDAKSIIEILTLAAERGTALVLEATGKDAQDAAQAIHDLFRDGFPDISSGSSGAQPQA